MRESLTVEINDSHCHFFSRRFFEVLAAQKGEPSTEGSVAKMVRVLDWEEPGQPADLAERWIGELDKHGVARSALMASVPGDEESVAVAVARHPHRLVGLFMLDPLQPGAAERVRWAVKELGLRCVCLFPAMHRYHIFQDEALAIFEAASTLEGAVVFVHCGVLSVGVRKKLGLASPFALRYSNPLDLHSVALSYPDLPIIIPHFGAGMFREALMVADLCPNLYLDTSSSNSWRKYGSLTLEKVFRRALDVVGPDRLLFGTDSSFFPRGWQKPVWESQNQVLQEIGTEEEVRSKIFGENFNALFPSAEG